MTINYKDHPTTNDSIKFEINILNEDGNLLDPYKVTRVSIFFISRSYLSNQYFEGDADNRDNNLSFYYNDTKPVKILGTDDFPAWLSTDQPNAFVQRDSIGKFSYVWDAQGCEEGDYFLCYSWTEVPGGENKQKVEHFIIASRSLTAANYHSEIPKDKYKKILDACLPEMFSLMLGEYDLTPDVIEKTNLSISDGYKDTEDWINKLYDIIDPNLIKENLLPYFANNFRLKLRSNSPILWRRQGKRAINVYKKKGTLSGLREALDSANIKLKSLDYYWQVVSNSYWQEGVAYNKTCVYDLEKFAIDGVASASLRPNQKYFDLFVRKASTQTYEEIPFQNYFVQNNAIDINSCPESNFFLSQLIIDQNYCNTLETGDYLKIIYKIKPVTNQSIEDYILTLDLADQRDETKVTYPRKNWNVRLINEKDPLFDSVIVDKHLYYPHLVYGKIRTLFPYGENIYNMDEYNGSIRDSNDYCHLDRTFYDVCSNSRSSSIGLNVGIIDISNDRITELNEIVKDYVPFHTNIHEVNFIGENVDVVNPAYEEIECLIQYEMSDNVLSSQIDFNRIIEDGLSNSDETKRFELSDEQLIGSGSNGEIYNDYIKLISDKIITDYKIGNNVLEVLSGTYTGLYSLGESLRVIGLNSISNNSPFPFQIYNTLFNDNNASIEQLNWTYLLPTINFSNFDFSNKKVKIDGNFYPVVEYSSDNKIKIINYPGPISNNKIFQLTDNSNNIIGNGIAKIDKKFVGKLRTQNILEYGIDTKSLCKINNVKYNIIKYSRENNEDHFILDNYNLGTFIGSISYQFLQEKTKIEQGYFDYFGDNFRTPINYEQTLNIQNGQNFTGQKFEDGVYKEQILIKINGNFYTILKVDGANFKISGPRLFSGLTPQNGIQYEIYQIFNSPLVTQGDKDFSFIDRRLGENIEMIQNDNYNNSFLALSLNGQNFSDNTRIKESIWYTIDDTE